VSDEKLKVLEKQARGRPKLYDRERLVGDVMNLFWERGYSDLSLNEIAQETGLTRASLYNAFNSKESLLMETLTHYFKMSPDARLEELRDGESVGKALFEMFDYACELRALDKKNRGCFGVNCMTELMNNGSNLGGLLNDIYEERRVFIVNLIARAITQGELPSSTVPEDAGNMVFAFMTGFNTFSKNGFEESRLKNMCRLFLQSVGFQSPKS
jgi:TetR/AcrR family transcriptional repressor of nem operon